MSYILEPYTDLTSRYTCPNCKHEKQFVRYINTESNKHIHSDVGRCNRQDNCGYHYTPKEYFKDNNISFENRTLSKIRPLPAVKPKAETQKSYDTIPFDVWRESLLWTKNGYDIPDLAERNYFIRFLLNRFGLTETLRKTIGLYSIGTSKHWDGATVFWQFDRYGKARTGKIMLYSPVTGKRVKEPYNYITWAHKALKTSNFQLRQCFFGEHLLGDRSKVVAIVESEKTAIVGSLYCPDFIWLACGSAEGLSAEKCSVLQGRNVLLYPDLKVFERWSKQAKELSHISSFSVSDLLERVATEDERKAGLDIADYFLRYPVSEFRSATAV